MPVLRHLVTALGLALLSAAPVTADDAPPVTQAFRTMLAVMPVMEDARPGSYQIDFGDVRAARALLEATGHAPFDPEERALAALLRGGTQIFGRSASAEETSFRAANGFGFADVETNIQYARPPIVLNVISLGFGAGPAAAETLPEAGFVPEDRQGQSVFWRGEEDNAIRQRGLPPDDLFGGALRRSVRLALEGDVLAYSSAWATLDTVLSNESARLVEDAEVAALLDALDRAAHDDERLILASLFMDVLPADYPGHLLTTDLFGDNGHVTLATFLPSAGLPAEDQAAQLQANWSGLPIGNDGGSLAQRLGADSVVQVIAVSQPVIVLRLETGFDPEQNRLVLNRGYGAFQSLLMRRDFDRLLNGTP